MGERQDVRSIAPFRAPIPQVPPYCRDDKATPSNGDGVIRLPWAEGAGLRGGRGFRRGLLGRCGVLGGAGAGRVSLPSWLAWPCAAWTWRWRARCWPSSRPEPGWWWRSRSWPNWRSRPRCSAPWLRSSVARLAARKSRGGGAACGGAARDCGGAAAILSHVAGQAPTFGKAGAQRRGLCWARASLFGGRS